MPTFRQIHDHVRDDVSRVTVNEAEQSLGSGAIALDVREPDETAQGTIDNAIVIPRGFLEMRIEQQVSDHDQPIVVYCGSGVRSAFAARSLAELGYTNVVSMDGGFDGWKQGGKAWSLPGGLNDVQQRRYSRHLLLPEVGEAGQQRLLDTKMLLIGAGGLGSPAGLYLAAAGVGTLAIIDADTVDESNLQRQVIHRISTVGQNKALSAAMTIRDLNPDVTVNAIEERLTPDNALELVKAYDVIVDGSDNFATRYVVNDACMIAGVPLVHGSIFRFDGQVLTIDPRQTDSPCYRCLFPEPPPSELAPNCAEAGVLGVLPGVIGLLQATEAIKLALDIGEPLVGRMLMFDALAMTFRTLRVTQDAECPVHGDRRPDSLDGITYTNESCAINVAPAP